MVIEGEGGKARRVTSFFTATRFNNSKKKKNTKNTTKAAIDSYKPRQNFMICCEINLFLRVHVTRFLSFFVVVFDQPLARSSAAARLPHVPGVWVCVSYFYHYLKTFLHCHFLFLLFFNVLWQKVG